MKSKYTTKFFPFSPGIPWKIKNGKYLIPDIKPSVWNLILNNREPVVIAHGGFLESFCSLMFLEMINFWCPQKQVYWLGDPKFNHLVWLNGLAKISSLVFSAEILKNYPVPIFMDKTRHVYFNCLNNYRTIRAYYGGKHYHNKKSAIKQIVANSGQDWDFNYVPKLRNLSLSPALERWAKSVRLHLNQPIVCIFPDKETGFSRHHISCLNWSSSDVKALGAILKMNGISLLVFTNHPGKYLAPNLFTCPMNLDFILYFLPKARAILSEEIDFLLVSNIISNAILFGKKLKNEFDLKKNNNFLSKENVIYTHNLTPIHVAKILGNT